MARKNKSKIPATRADLDKAQRIINKKIEKMRSEATSDALTAVQGIYLKALADAFGFQVEDFIKLQETVDALSDRITDPEDEFSFLVLKQELEDIGVCM